MDELKLKIAGQLFELVIAGLGALILMAYKKFKVDETRQKMILLAADVGYGVVNNLAAKTETKIDDKVAEGLKAVVEFLKANNHDAPNEAETSQIKMLFDAKHGNEAVAAEAVKAAVAASP